ncbi:T9SS type A sorting domain-containing protein [Dyadobacter sp. LHD-138]|uniref:T9SS type A sorting domain-containing protein n=1 Tax=Dyadobacter sp. LHD-138 TaxID=3071413 RepID=UPI0027E0872E|nr:T9SS type A sorting domain-containing protein [Dyadobacter sp. LHD-138]MDQ6482064.1 T9SS type A sorting domain-containing protein [Dyadobacter sp. LHD-138]
MTTYRLFPAICCVLLLCMAKVVSAQTNYMEQNFSGGGPFVSPNPGIGQFSHLITTNAALSKYEFGPGYMDLIRLQEDSTTGGIVRALRAVPFFPNPETLYIQLTFSVEEIGAAATNALYFYLGENFSPTNNKIPANALLFSRFSLNFLASSFVVHDIETGKNSSPLPLHAPVTLTWVLNNSPDGQIYRKPENAAKPDYKVMPGKYDLWVNEILQVNDADAYPGASAYSVSKLSNFEIRFRNGVGKVRFTSLRIRDVTGVLPLHIVLFKAEKGNGKVRLYWETAIDRDSDRFMISKRGDKHLYNVIGDVKAKGRIGEAYALVDDVPGAGVNYYRVEQIDKSGQVIDARETELSFGENMEFYLSPNPVSAELIRVNSFGAKPELMKIYDLNGSALAFDFKTSEDGVIEIRPRNKITSGVYILSFSRNSIVKYLRFLVE